MIQNHISDGGIPPLERTRLNPDVEASHITSTCVRRGKGVIQLYRMLYASQRWAQNSTDSYTPSREFEGGPQAPPVCHHQWRESLIATILILHTQGVLGNRHNGRRLRQHRYRVKRQQYDIIATPLKYMLVRIH